MHHDVPKRNSAVYFQSECTRITVPMVCLDDIHSAAIILRKLADDLAEIAAHEQRITAKILEARMHCTWASMDLKRGSKYKGKTT
jgi:hypothetical protein